MTLPGDSLARRTREAELFDSLAGDCVRCVACGHECRIPPGAVGVCKVRFNEGGRLRAPWGYTAGVQCDPIEKKPFFHAWPGSLALSFGMLGCDLHCGYCQNWITSQALRDPRAATRAHDTSAEAVVASALRIGARAVVSTYNEPLITAEWGVEVFRQARAVGLATAFVSNGNATARVLDYLGPWIDLYKVDLKSFRDARYRKLGGRLQPILDTIAALPARGIWMEVVTLLVPGFNDDPGELRELVAFLAGVSPDIPWHVTAFHQDYKMTDAANTTPRMLLDAARLGREAGLRYVYAGNLPRRVAGFENTSCPGCRRVLVERTGYHVLRNDLEGTGTCPACHALVAGRWDTRRDSLPATPLASIGSGAR
jgi:pyruvate formate lyase activating enzyme